MEHLYKEPEEIRDFPLWAVIRMQALLRRNRMKKRYDIIMEYHKENDILFKYYIAATATTPVVCVIVKTEKLKRIRTKTTHSTEPGVQDKVEKISEMVDGYVIETEIENKKGEWINTEINHCTVLIPPRLYAIQYLHLAITL